MAARSPALEGPPTRLERPPLLATAARRMLTSQLATAVVLALTANTTHLIQPRSSTRATLGTP